MIKIGEYNTLKILRETSVGLFLGDESGEDVLLPNKYCPEVFFDDEEIEVFVYLDYAERKIATNLIPKIHLNEFAYLQVQEVSEIGAFLDWGLEKGLLVPFSEQPEKMEVGKSYVVCMLLDEKTNRLYASARIEHRLSNESLELSVNDEVDALVYQESELGYSVIINDEYKGLIYKNEVFTSMNIGHRSTAFVKKIREENKLDISLHPIGYDQSIDQFTEILHTTLIDEGGSIALTDKSSPEDIKSKLGISKKAFKKAVGDLYKQRKITIEEDCIKLTKNNILKKKNILRSGS